MGVLDVFSWEGLSVAPASSLLAVTPTWTRLDNLGEGTRLSEVKIRRGRQTEFDRSDAGELTAGFRDELGAVDPTLVDWIGRPLAFAVRNPVTDEWQPRFRGSVEAHDFNLDPSVVKGDVVIEALDVQDYLANIQLMPGVHGDPPPAASAGWVFYEDTAVTGPQIRINAALDDAGFPSGLSSIFTGNVNLLETVYSDKDSIMSVINDAADAELPGIGQRFVDRYGVFCFHGRNARFSPATTAATATHWDFHEWDAGIGGVQITWPFNVRAERRMIRNLAICYPQGIAQADLDGQVAEDSGSQDDHGVRTWSAPNLIVKDGITSGFTGEEECLSYAGYIVANYATVKPRLPQITIKPLRPTDPRAPELWDMATKIDISDVVNVVRPFPGGGGINESYFVEGITEVWRPLHKDLETGYPYFEITLDLSPSTYWTTEPE